MCKQNLLYDLAHDTITHRIPFHGLEAGAFDHGDEFGFGHFGFAAGLDRVRGGDLAALHIRGAPRSLVTHSTLSNDDQRIIYVFRPSVRA